MQHSFTLLYFSSSSLSFYSPFTLSLSALPFKIVVVMLQFLFIILCLSRFTLSFVFFFFFFAFSEVFSFFWYFFFLFCFLNFLLLNICWQIVAAQNTIFVSVVVVICWKVAAIAIVMAYGICERERKEGEKLQKFRLVSFCLEAKNTAILGRDVDGEFISD